MDKAEDMLSEDAEGERNSDRGSSPKKSEGGDVHGAEVSERLLSVRGSAGGPEPRKGAPAPSGCISEPAAP